MDIKEKANYIINYCIANGRTKGINMAEIKLQDTYDKGYKEGTSTMNDYSKGYKEGYSKGYDEGYSDSTTRYK
jgi:flagellar biosynthesis/type III secretory pathway protein FliH